MKYKLVVSDFDDTLTDETQIIPEADRRAISDYIASGGKFCICTGRMISAVLPFARSLYSEGEVIGYQGSVVADVKTGKFLYENAVPYAVAHSIGEWLEERGVYYQIYEDDTFVVREETDYSRFYGKFTSLPPKVTNVKLTDYMRGKHLSPTKMLVMTEPDKVDGYIAELSRVFGRDVLVNTSKKFILEIVRKGVDKGTAVSDYAKTLGISLNEVMCIGDSLNDVPMLKVAGLGVVVDNGSPAAKSVAGLVVSSAMSGGVAEAIALAMKP